MNSLWIGKHHTSHTIGVLRWLKISMECLSWCAFVVSEWFAFVVSEWFAFQCREWVICFVVTQNTKERHRRVNSFIVKNVNYDHGDFVPKKKTGASARAGRGMGRGGGRLQLPLPSPPLPSPSPESQLRRLHHNSKDFYRLGRLRYFNAIRLLSSSVVFSGKFNNLSNSSVNITRTLNTPCAL